MLIELFSLGVTA